MQQNMWFYCCCICTTQWCICKFYNKNSLLF